jgi:uncharacterized repeat protein (TIGR01451 family)
MAEWAGVNPPIPVDGMSFVKLLREPQSAWRDSILIESLSRPPNIGANLHGARTSRYLYAELQTGFIELYDLQTDPYQLTNLANQSTYAPVVNDMRNRLHQFRFTTNLVLTQSAFPASVAVGSTVTYAITVSNQGPRAAHTITIKDLLPSNTTFVSCAASTGGMCMGWNNDRKIGYRTLEVGGILTATLVAKVKPTVSQGTTVKNTSSVTTLTSSDPTPADDAMTTSVVVGPPESIITLATDPSGLRVTLDGQTVTTPFSIQSVETVPHTLGVISPQTVNSVTYQWLAWSDGGAATHSIATPTHDQTYTARFAPVPDIIFTDDFESGNLALWPTRWTDGGDLSVTPAAALVGSRGLHALLDDNTPITVLDERPQTEARYWFRFYFDPNALVMGQGTSHVLFFGYAGSSLSRPVVQVELFYASGQYQVRAGLLNDGITWRNGSRLPISDAIHMLELDWRAATAPGTNDGSLAFWVDGVLRSSLAGVDNDTRRVERVRLGAAAGIDPNTQGVYFIDAFESRRASAIGPAAGAQAIVAEMTEVDPAELYGYVDEIETEPPAEEQLPDPQQTPQNPLYLPFLPR